MPACLPGRDYAPLFRLAHDLDSAVDVPGTSLPACSGSADVTLSGTGDEAVLCSTALSDPAPQYAVAVAFRVTITGFTVLSGSGAVRLVFRSDELGTDWLTLDVSADGTYSGAGIFASRRIVAGMTVDVVASGFPAGATHVTFDYAVTMDGDGWRYQDPLSPPAGVVPKMTTADPGAGWEAVGYDDSGWADPLGMPAWVNGGYFSGQFFWPTRFPADAGEACWVRMTLTFDPATDTGNPNARAFTPYAVGLAVDLFLPGYRITHAYLNGTDVSADMGAPIDTPNVETQYSANFDPTLIRGLPSSDQVLALRVAFPDPAGHIITVGEDYTGDTGDPYRKGMQSGIQVTLEVDACLVFPQGYGGWEQ